MKKLILAIIILICFVSCNKKQDYTHELQWPENENSIYITSDFHWQKEGDNFRLLYLDEIIDTLLDETIKNNPKALLVCGDITNGGTVEEHLEISSILNNAENEGIEIFVVMGNHDMDAKLSPDIIKETYGDLGFNQSFSQDENTLSYAAKLNDEVWLLSLDLNVYGEIESDMAGYISNETLLWIENILAKAEKEGAMVVPFSHHNLIEHAMEDLTHHYNIENGDKLKQLLLDYGVPVYISGHRHSSFIASEEVDGRRIDELVIDMPASYPYRYTEIKFNAENTISYDTKLMDISKWAKDNEIEDEIFIDFDEFSKNQFDEQLILNSSSIDKLTDDEIEVEKLKKYYIAVLTAQKERTLWRDYKALKEDEALDLWEQYKDENIFARWIPWVLENQTNDELIQVLGPYR